MLIVDDDDDVVAGAGRMGAAWHITVARDLTSASCLIRRQRFDVVLLDIAMTGETLERGIAFVAFARTRQPGARIVVASAFGGPGIVEQVLGGGADEFLHKPLQICLTRSLANF